MTLVSGCASAPPPSAHVSAFQSTTASETAAASRGSSPQQATQAPCDPAAVPSVHPGAGRDSYPPGEPGAAGTAPVTRAAAIGVAHGAAFGGPFDAPTTAIEERYAALGEHGNDPSIAPQRCVWVVVTQAPVPVYLLMSPRPFGATPQAYSRFTVVLDAASGFLVEFEASK